MLSGCDLYQTEYVIWSNYGLQAEGGDLEAFQLSAHVLDQLDIHEGYLTGCTRTTARTPTTSSSWRRWSTTCSTATR